MGKISNNELAAVLIDRKRLSKKNASRFINELFNVIRQGLMNERLVKVKGLGTFKIIDVDDRESVNVNTGERVLIEGHSKISFTPDALMKELVNKPFSQFETVVLKDGVDFEDVPEETEIEESKLEPVVEPEPEPVTAPEPEFVVEPEPEDHTSFYEDDLEPSSAPLVDFVTPDELSEDLSEEIIVNKPEEIVEEKTEDQQEGIEEPKDVVEPEETKEVTDSSEKVIESEEPEESSESESPLYEFDDDESGSQWKKWLLIAALCCACFGGGYFVGQHFANGSSTVPVAQPEVKKDVQPVAQPKAQPEIQPEAQVETQSGEKADVATEPKAEEQIDAKPDAKSEVKPEVKSETKSEAKPETKPEVKPAPQLEAKSVVPTESAATLDQYEKMDIRVRTGAYRIVGTDHVEKVKAGDNLSRICKRTIGAGMECYLEVYNGISGDIDLKAGQQIKIPKLELKKKKAKLAN